MKYLIMMIISTIIFSILFPEVYSTYLSPKTLSELYHGYGLIIIGKVLSISQIPEKHLTAYDFQVLEYITPPQQSKFITAVYNSSNMNGQAISHTQIPFSVGDVIQLYLENSTSGYYISPYSFKLPGKCQDSSIGPNYVSETTVPISTPAYSWRLFDSQGNLIVGAPPLNKEIFVKPSGDIINVSPFENRTIELSIIREGDAKPILQEIKQIDTQPCSLIDPKLEFTPEQPGNYSINVKILGGIYDNKIMIDNSTTFTSGFSFPINSQNGTNSNSIQTPSPRTAESPEFPFTISILLASITSLIVFYRIKFR